MGFMRPLCTVLLVAASALTAAPAAASDVGLMRTGGAWSFDLDLRIQMQVKLLRITRLPSFELGGVEAQSNFSVKGLGAAAGLGFERLRAFEGEDSQLLYGGYLMLSAQWRPAATFDKHLFEWFDPHIDLGGKLGGVESPQSGAFRGAFTLGGGFDVGIHKSKKWHPVLSLDYRFDAARAPDDVARHFLLFGGGARYAD